MDRRVGPAEDVVMVPSMAMPKAASRNGRRPGAPTPARTASGTTSRKPNMMISYA